MDNIYKNQEDGILTKIDNKIVKNKYFEIVVKSKEFKSLDELNDFFTELRNIFTKCPKNDYGVNLLPIDPNTGKEIDPENFLVENGYCVNSTNKSSFWKNLLGLFVISLMAGTSYVNNDTSFDSVSNFFIKENQLTDYKTTIDANGNKYFYGQKIDLNSKYSSNMKTFKIIQQKFIDFQNFEFRDYTENNLKIQKDLLEYGIKLYGLKYKINNLNGIITIKFPSYSYRDENMIKYAYVNSLINVKIEKNENEIILTINTNNEHEQINNDKYKFIGLSTKDSVEKIKKN